MDLNITNFEKDGIPTCGFTPFLEYFTSERDDQTVISWDDNLKGLVVIARNFIPRGDLIHLNSPNPYNDYSLLKRG